MVEQIVEQRLEVDVGVDINGTPRRRARAEDRGDDRGRRGDTAGGAEAREPGEQRRRPEPWWLGLASGVRARERRR